MIRRRSIRAGSRILRTMTRATLARSCSGSEGGACATISASLRVKIFTLWYARICPGRFLADSTIFLAIAGIIATFDILPAKTQGGEDVLPEPSFASGVVR